MIAMKCVRFCELKKGLLVVRNQTARGWKRAISNYNFNEVVSIPSSSGNPMNFPSIWLRHHCQCEKCFNPKTYQRMIIPQELPNLSVIDEISRVIPSNAFQVSWKDGHKSRFDLSWLQRVYSEILNLRSPENYHHEVSETPSFKISQEDNPLTNAVEFTEFMNPSNENGVAKLLESILQRGYGIVKNAPADFETTKKVVLRISHPQTTLFGDFSEWTSNLAHADTAYTTDVVHLHTDTSYFSEPIGLQMFHCLKHDGTGGLNSLADGFKVAHKLKTEFPNEHLHLSRGLIPSQYLDPGKHHFHSVDLTIKHNISSNKMERIRYNPHDMGVLDTIPFDLISPFYRSLVKWSQELETSPTWIKLSPGIIIFLDNWRTLHGRTAFTGFRHLCGAYIARSDWQSKARVLGVIE